VTRTLNLYYTQLQTQNRCRFRQATQEGREGSLGGESSVRARPDLDPVVEEAVTAQGYRK
jgi:hypothetical protein